MIVKLIKFNGTDIQVFPFEDLNLPLQVETPEDSIEVSQTIAFKKGRLVKCKYLPIVVECLHPYRCHIFATGDVIIPLSLSGISGLADLVLLEIYHTYRFRFNLSEIIVSTVSRQIDVII